VRTVSAGTLHVHSKNSLAGWLAGRSLKYWTDIGQTRFPKRRPPIGSVRSERSVPLTNTADHSHSAPIRSEALTSPAWLSLSVAARRCRRLVLLLTCVASSCCRRVSNSDARITHPLVATPTPLACGELESEVLYWFPTLLLHNTLLAEDNT